MRLADISPAQEADAFPSQVHDDDVLVGVRRLLPTVEESLFFRVFQPLSTPFGAIDDEPRLCSCSGLTPGKVIGVPRREDTQAIESIS